MELCLASRQDVFDDRTVHGAQAIWSRQVVTRTDLPTGGCVVVAARAESVEAGLEMLRRGGNAVDAAIAMAYAAAVTEPTETSIGGSGFMVVRPAAGPPASVEFGPRAPRAAEPGTFAPLDEERDSALAVAAVRGDGNVTGFRAPTVPGVVAGLELARARLGTLSRAQLLEPAIALAEDGFEIDEYYALQALANLHSLRANDAAAGTFLHDRLPPVPDFARARMGRAAPRLRQRDLAATLRAIAAGGADAFYRGDVGAAIAADLARNGGLIDRQDLAAYAATIERPLQIPYRDHHVLAPRAPSGALTALQALRILGHVDLRSHRRSDPRHALAMAGCLRLAFADRYRLFGDRAPDGRRHVLSDAYARTLAARLGQGAVAEDPTDAGAAPADVGHGTSHMCAIDAAGNAVSCTITVGESFGSKVVAAGTGVLLDSGMAWFDPRPGRPNSIAPCARPLVNMAPLVLVGPDRTSVAALGASGGRRIVSAVVQLVVDLVDHGMTPAEAVAAPRLDASEDVVRVSDRMGAATALAAAGYRVKQVGEQHRPFLYELAHPAVAALAADGTRRGGFHPYSTGFAAGY